MKRLQECQIVFCVVDGTFVAVSNRNLDEGLSKIADEDTSIRRP